ncbi:ATP-binding protein [Streptomyces sp. NPDC101490]|uniref:ATP-binding protein n=1 Tax=Streptomyces sp. NPDC101490 TaxID=3366143 RepID=UPI003809EBDF
MTFSHVGDGDVRGGPPLASAAPNGPAARGDSHAPPSWAPVTDATAGPAASHPTGHPAYFQTLPREPKSAMVARRLVRTVLTLWGLEPLIEDATLVVTELASNAADHGRLRWIHVGVARPSTHVVRLSVADRSRVVPPRRTVVDDDHSRGRGLFLVDALALRWGTELYPWGKQVWADLGKGGAA